MEYTSADMAHVIYVTKPRLAHFRSYEKVLVMVLYHRAALRITRAAKCLSSLAHRKLHRWLFDFYNRRSRAGRVARVVEHHPSKHEALSSNSSAAPTKRIK
jgi:hypothetical protein